MQVMLPTKFVQPTHSEMWFLRELDKKTRQPPVAVTTTYGHSEHTQMTRSLAPDFQMSMRDVDRIEELARVYDNDSGIVLFPRSVSMGFAVGYEVGQVKPPFELSGARPRYKPLLVFGESQLPPREGTEDEQGVYWFERLSKTFMGSENVSLLDSAGMQREMPVNSRIRYGY